LMSPRRVVACAALLAGTGALVPAPVRTQQRSLERRVSYLSEVEEAGKEKHKEGVELPTNPRDHALVTESVNEGPANYDGFIDAADGFDGGDGQVGVVGDGTNAMETFDKSQAVEQQGRLRVNNAIGGTESKKTQKNVWGYSTGYAEELKARGMVDIDEFGEDRLKARRQQLENFRNQAEVRVQKEGAIRDLAALQGKEYQPQRHGQYLKSMEGQTDVEVDMVAGTQREPVLAGGAALTAGDTVHGTLSFKTRLEARDGTTLEIDNEFAMYSDFVAGFTAGSSGAFSVEPNEGTLNRRGGDPQQFVVKFRPTAYSDVFEGTLVVQTEDYTWTYECVGHLN